MGLTLVTAPAEEPISVEEAKVHLRIDGDEDNNYLDGLITAARQKVEADLERVLVTQTWDWVLDEFPVEFEVPFPPLVSVGSITYLDTAGSSQTLASSVYIVDTDSEKGRIALDEGQSWPSTQPVVNAVTVQFTAGYGDAGDVPEGIKHAIKFLVAQWYEIREPVITGTIIAEVPIGYKSLIWHNKVARFV